VTHSEAKQNLNLRRGPADDADPEVAEAMAMAVTDPELRAWLAGVDAFQPVLRSAFRDLPVPGDLEARILSHAEPKPLPWWRRFPAWAAAAALIATLAVVLVGSRLGRPSDDSFEIFRSRMVRSVLRQYQMDVETNNATAIRQYLSVRAAPSNYRLTPGLARLPLRGAGVQSWLGERVTMVCFGAERQGTAILFIVDAKGVKSPPPTEPDFQQVSKLMTASWTTQDQSYLLMVDNPAVDRPGLSRLLQGTE